MITKISVIIPTCDRPTEFLKESVGSALNQTAKPFEIIIVNNGKSPIKLPDDLARNVKVLEAPPYIGASPARNYGAKKAEGDFIAFLDDDTLEHLPPAITAQRKRREILSPFWMMTICGVKNILRIWESLSEPEWNAL